MKNRRYSDGVSGVPETPRAIHHIDYQGTYRWTNEDVNPNENLESFEALLRSLDLVDVSRRQGEMHLLTCNILRIVCEEIRETDSAYPVHVNMPPHCMTQQMFEDVLSIVDGYGIPHRLIGFEILEHEFACTEEIILTAQKFQANGFHLYLDDYQGLPHQDEALRFLPIDVVKIDRTYLDGFSATLTGTLRDLEALGFHTFIIEGAESPMHMNMIRWAMETLRPETTIHVQGFGLSRPSHDALRRHTILH
jgi:EAL domain-containing protein (putative c-di-GMP-specific phosphodiesterase class I)